MSKVKRKPPNFYSRPCGRGDAAALVCNRQIPFYFYSRPCGRGDVFFQREEAVFHISTHAPAGGATSRIYYVDAASYISTHAPAGGATVAFAMARTVQSPFLLTPLREGRHRKHAIFDRKLDFYSRPCGRGDASRKWSAPLPILISTHAPAGGATISNNGSSELVVFLLTPLREGRPKPFAIAMLVPYFYSRPCGRGDQCEGTPLFFATYFYSRPCGRGDGGRPESEKANAFISTHAPAGGATGGFRRCGDQSVISTHAPAGGATRYKSKQKSVAQFLLTPLREGRRTVPPQPGPRLSISTHAPAGGATAIFHKSVMRFCGKLPKDDTVLCLASFGFPRRDPKAVYLAWISCANLPQKCVRQGLALKDQGTSCFHEGLASHAFVPVLV